MAHETTWQFMLCLALGSILTGCIREESGLSPAEQEAMHTGYADHHDHLSGADAGPGHRGQIEFDGGLRMTTYWTDTDGVDPGTAGCHDEWTNDKCEHILPGRDFGERCLDNDRLLETNPGAGVCHPHANDIGHPDVFSCDAWCKGAQGAAGGRCEGGIWANSMTGVCLSAACKCCVGMGALCDSDEDCCGGLGCFIGVCAPVTPADAGTAPADAGTAPADAGTEPQSPCEVECQGGLMGGDACDPQTGWGGMGGECQGSNEEDIFCCEPSFGAADAGTF